MVKHSASRIGCLGFWLLWFSSLLISFFICLKVPIVKEIVCSGFWCVVKFMDNITVHNIEMVSDGLIMERAFLYFGNCWQINHNFLL